MSDWREEGNGADIEGNPCPRGLKRVAILGGALDKCSEIGQNLGVAIFGKMAPVSVRDRAPTRSGPEIRSPAQAPGHHSARVRAQTVRPLRFSLPFWALIAFFHAETDAPIPDLASSPDLQDFIYPLFIYSSCTP